MPVLEFEKKAERSNDILDSEEYTIIVNGRKDSQSLIYRILKDTHPNPSIRILDQRFAIDVRDVETLKILTAYKVIDLNKIFRLLYFNEDLPFWQRSIKIRIFMNRSTYPVYELSAELNFDELESWNKSYSFSNWKQEFKSSIEELKTEHITYSSGETYMRGTNFGIQYLLEDQNRVIQESLDNFFVILSKLIDSTYKKVSQLNDNSVFTHFYFPAHIKTACEQYLVYFAQFLADIGVSANIEIKEEALQTLFKVIPTDKETALETIQEALETYLNLPSDNSFQLYSDANRDVAVIQLEANVQSLKTQLMLLNATYKAQQATIAAQEVTIRVLNLNSYRSDIALPISLTQTPEQEESVIPGIVTVKNLDMKGVSIKLPELLRRMKRIFKKYN